MGKQRKKLTLNKETLRDLTEQNAGEVKGGPKGGKTKNKCLTQGATCTGYPCHTCGWCTLGCNPTLPPC